MVLQTNIPYWISFDLSLGCWISMAVAFLAVMWLLGAWVSRMRLITIEHNENNEEMADPNSEVGLSYPPVSVIITALPNTPSLMPLVEAVLAQNYPAPYEVVVVIDGVDHSAHDTLHRLMLNHSNLYATFVPEDSRNLSRRKLSLTLGIKASQFDMLMFTQGNCRVISPMWLKSMMRHAADGCEIVVGWSLPMQIDERESGRLRRAYDTVWSAMTWLPSAIKGHPFMATGRNLAYSREIFFNHKGFSKSLHIKGGEDDMFLNEIAKGVKCGVELSDVSMIEEEVENARMAHRNSKVERFFTSKWLPLGPSLMMGSFSLSWWIWLLSSASACVLGLPSFLPSILMAIMGIVMIVICSLQWKALSISLGIIPTVWSFPFLALWHPFYQLGYRIKSFNRRKKNYTWN